MGILLYPHNQTAYEAAVRLMETSRKAAVIHPTGTGKSYIAFQLAREHPDQRICWLAPSEHIFHTQLENLCRDAGEGKESFLQNIIFLTYSRLTADEEMIDTLRPDYIVLDEFHRCGAAEWGKSVRRLLETYPGAGILGLSATNIRYLDGQRDMAQEIFEGHIASEMTLGEAIVRGILPSPTYVTSLYSYQEEYRRWRRRVSASGNKGLLAENEALLEKLRRALEQADGLDKIFYKYMHKKDGKYIVFCADKEHMDAMQEKIREWFGLVDKEPHVYTAYYNNPEMAEDFTRFKKDNSDHLKLLYCIDMLNEGIHVEDIDGVILLRPTVSPILYLQQIGRALSAGKNAHPVIFDIVNNYESLYCIDSLRDELERALERMPCTREEKERFRNGFRLMDEVKPCRELFEGLERNLSATWDIYYREAKKYYDEYGNLKVPKRYVTGTGLTLGSWLQNQRRVYEGKAAGSLTEEKIDRLNAIGMVWNVRTDNWEEGYAELLAYHKKYGNADVKARYVSESGYPLGKWISNLRGAVKKKGIDYVLNKSQQQLLQKVGMIWDKNGDIWNRYLRAAEEYYRTNGNLDVPAKYVTEDNIPLGSWLQSIKFGMSGSVRRMETLSAAQVEQLNALGMNWERENTLLWDVKFRLAREYYEQHGNLEIPAAYCVQGVKLGRWISNIRAKRKNPRSSGMMLNEKRIHDLDSIGMNWK